MSTLSINFKISRTTVIVNSRFGQRYWLRELFALLAKTLAHQSASARPPCSKAAILFYPPAVPCRQFPALSIRFKGCLFSCVLYDCTCCSQICDSQALGFSAFKTHACLRFVGAVLDSSSSVELCAGLRLFFLLWAVCLLLAACGLIYCCSVASVNAQAAGLILSALMQKVCKEIKKE